MSDEFRYDVFLSYSPKDKEAVHAIGKRLQAVKAAGVVRWPRHN
jgi:hypothetical protein